MGVFENYNENLLKKRGERRRRAIALALAGVMVAGLTGYTLMSPAETISEEPVCGFTEHVHTAECYTALEPAYLTCLQTDPVFQTVHQHTDACYEKDEHGNRIGLPICGYADFVLHTHTAECYNSQGQLICPIPENKGHEHKEECYALMDVLVCTVPERPAVAGHTHTDACYTMVNT